MHAAQVLAFGQAPQYTTVPDLPTTASSSDDTLTIAVQAVGLHNLVRLRASGNHYSAQTVPHTLGVDGVGTISDGPRAGEKVFFNAIPIGRSFQDTIQISAQHVAPLASGADVVQVAALTNPALSSWMALRRRVRDVPKKFSVIILGATSASGRVAIPLLRFLGANRIVGVARNETALKKLDLEEIVVLQENASETVWGDAVKGVDIVLDYLMGEPALKLLEALPGGTRQRTQYVQIGNMAGSDFALPSMLLRSKDLVLSGSGIGSWLPPDISEELPELMQAMALVPKQDIRVEHLKEIEKVWGEKESRRIVFVTDNYTG
jgi:NADPH:quinone reductase-like Zn-dependent oxidoreductase